MAVLARNNWLSQQRLDLSNLLAEQSFAQYDFRAMLQMFNGIKKNYVINGLEVVGVSGLAATISIKNSMVVLPLDGIASFYTATQDDPDEQIILPPAIDNVYVEAYFERTTQTPVTTAFFDPGATTPSQPAGSEFTASVDFQQVVTLKLRFKTDGFSVDAVPIATFKTSSTQITEVEDARNLFFRLGTGGASPNPFNRYEWSTQREETSNPGLASAIGQLNTGNPYFVADANGAKNDKAFQSLKDWMDAVMTVLAEMKGTPTWYTPTAGKTVPSLLFLSGNATSVVPTPNRSIQWSRANDELLRSKGTGLPTSWAQNFGDIRWYLGGTFLSGTTRRFNDASWTCGINESQAVFLRLEREIRPAGVPANPVKWGLESINPAALIIAPISRHVKGQEGDFTGVAIGDYVRREGDDYFQYYRVVGIVEAGTPIYWDFTTQAITDAPWGQIATNACTGLILERSVLATSTEPYRWFRASYSQEDMYLTNLANPFSVSSNSGSPLTIPIDDINLYWLGRRSSQLGSEIFLFRDYGNMNPGEEMAFLEDADGSIKSIPPQVFLTVDPGTTMDGSGSLNSVTSTVLTLEKRKTDNLVNSGTNNQNGRQVYQIPEPSTLSFTTDGDGLWVRLDDGQVGVGTLVSGTVDPAEPTVPTTNVFEILPATVNPLRNSRNTDVFLVARRITYNGVVSLQFFDGTIVQSDGIALQKDITKVVTGVTTSTVANTTVTHNYLVNTENFIWGARRSGTGEAVSIGATHTATGLSLLDTPGGAETLTVVFTRHIP